MDDSDARLFRASCAPKGGDCGGGLSMRRRVLGLPNSLTHQGRGGRWLQENFRRKLFRVPASVNRMDRIGRYRRRRRKANPTGGGDDAPGRTNPRDSPMFACRRVFAGFRRIYPPL